MGITSLQFIVFIAITTILFYACPCGYQWGVLLVASIAFYLSYSVEGIFVITGTALITWFLALQIQKVKEREQAWMAENRGAVDKETRKAKKEEFQRRSRRYEVLAIIITVGLLFLSKYYGTMVKGINLALGTQLWTAENILLPLGISYYSLQLMGYIIDVERDIIPAEKNPLKVFLYGIFFLSIMQGPFNRYNELMPQICREERPKLTAQQLKYAVLRIAGGYIKKLCIADQVGIITSEVFAGSAQYSGLGNIFGIICFAVQLYADFSGYMDIVIGIGELLGIHMPENFRQPFFSRSNSEFWKRWHITLGLWLQDYIFYPILKSHAFKSLGKFITKHLGKEAGKSIPTYLGMLILWTLIGAWHGAGFNYVFGVGILQFLYIFTGEITRPLSDKAKTALKIKEEGLLWHIFQSLRTTLLMMVAWIFFKSRTFSDALQYIRNIFVPGMFQAEKLQEVFQSKALSGQYETRWIVYTCLCIAVLFVMDIMKEKGICIRCKVESQPALVRLSVYACMVAALLVFGAYGSQYVASNFIYFDF